MGSGVGLERFHVLASPSSVLPSYASGLEIGIQRGREEVCVHLCAFVCVYVWKGWQ